MRAFIGFILFAVLLPAFSVAAVSDTLNIPDRPSPRKYVNDFTNTLNRDQRGNLENSLRNYSEENHQEIVIAIVDSTGQEDLSEYAYELIKKWKIGYNDDEKGIVILVDMHFKKVAIGIGDGLEHQLSPSTGLNLVKKFVVPAFAKSDYYGGLTRCAQGIEVMLIPVSVLKSYTDNYHKGRNYFIIAALILVVTLLGYFILFGRTKSTPGS